MSTELTQSANDPVDAELAEDMARYELAKQGQSVSHAAVRAWLLSKNTDNPLPRPKAGD